MFSLVLFSLLAITGLISAGVFVVQFRILHPLLTARKMIVSMAQDKNITLHPPWVGERDQLFYSIEILKIRLEERTELTSRTKYLAETDSLTGLFNRRAFDVTRESWLSRFHMEVNIYLVIMDYDYFKMINNRYGHPLDDRVLIAAADFIRGHLRESDMAARIGGEEFALIILGKGSAAALWFAECIRQELHNLDFRTEDGVQIKITTSFGIAGTTKNTSNTS
ncbi:GGDEF domain-containing protein [Pantoea sp. At-9b]|uniref:GGDEF domain-containing protein n=1 Tax=Pantoea sp. (strain At-9b) TaxID=592316 RepID=UPI00059EEBA0|nr:GGDEF domain-containing protein [Pantoea sp. At-9b]